MMRSRPVLPVLLALAAACGGDDAAVRPGATTAPPPATGALPSLTPTPSPTIRSKHGSAVLTGPDGPLTLPEVGCEATHDRTGAVLGFYAVFGLFEGRPLNDPDVPRVEVHLRKGYRGNGTYTADVEAVVGEEGGGRHQGPARRLVVSDDGRKGALTFVTGNGRTITAEYACDTVDPVAPNAAPAPPPPGQERGTALFIDRDGAVVRYTGLRCGRGTGDNTYLTAGTRTTVDALTLETDLTAYASLKWRHFGVEHVYSRREFGAEVTDGEVRYLRNGDVIAKVEWACPS